MNNSAAVLPVAVQVAHCGSSCLRGGEIPVQFFVAEVNSSCQTPADGLASSEGRQQVAAARTVVLAVADFPHKRLVRGPSPSSRLEQMRVMRELSEVWIDQVDIDRLYFLSAEHNGDADLAKRQKVVLLKSTSKSSRRVEAHQLLIRHVATIPVLLDTVMDEGVQKDVLLSCSHDPTLSVPLLAIASVASSLGPGETSNGQQPLAEQAFLLRPCRMSDLPQRKEFKREGRPGKEAADRSPHAALRMKSMLDEEMDLRDLKSEVKLLQRELRDADAALERLREDSSTRETILLSELTALEEHLLLSQSHSRGGASGSTSQYRQQQRRLAEEGISPIRSLLGWEQLNISAEGSGASGTSAAVTHLEHSSASTAGIRPSLAHRSRPENY